MSHVSSPVSSPAMHAMAYLSPRPPQQIGNIFRFSTSFEDGSLWEVTYDGESGSHARQEAAARATVQREATALPPRSTDFRADTGPFEQFLKSFQQNLNGNRKTQT